ncbi:MAG TPA: sigma-70 family RNA polymerase sigma factor, partial [Polyangia bacterium]
MSADPRSDEELIAAARSGDRAAVEALLSRHEQQIYRFGMRMCRNSEDAKEVLQETLLAMARNLPDFRAQSTVATWLYTIARSFCIKQRRLRKDEPSAHAPLDAARDVAAPAATPEEAAATRQVDRAVDDAIAELAPEYREVLILRDAEDLSYEEIRAILRLPITTLKIRVVRGRAMLRNLVERV